MVRAILEGRKTQTRRVVKHFDWFEGHLIHSCLGAVRKGEISRYEDLISSRDGGIQRRCPHGSPGDRLWVRESFLCFGSSDSITPPVPRACQIRYKADEGPATWIPMPLDAKQPTPSLKGKPSIHMPRWVSRITLEIVSVRVERLQDITEADAIAEGVEVTPVADLASRVLQFQGKGVQVAAAVVAYAHLWETINGPGSWKANPWVWVVEFKRVEREVVA